MDVSTLGKFLVAGRDARALLDRVFPLDVGAIAPGRARYLLALDEAGYVMDDGLVAALPDGSLLRDVDVGWRRPDGGVAPQLGRPARAARAPGRPDRTARRDQRRRVRAHASCSRPCPTTTSRVRRSPTRDTRRSTVAGVPCRGDRGRLRRRALLRAAPPSQHGASSCGMRCVTAGARPGTSCPTAWTPSTCSGSRRGTSTSRRTRCPTTTPRSSGSGGRSRRTSPLRRQARARADGRAAARATARRSAVRRPTAARPPARGRRRRSSGGSPRARCRRRPAAPIGLGWVRAIDGVFPEVLHAGDVTASVVADPLLRPRGGAPACLSFAPPVGVIVCAAEPAALDRLVSPPDTAPARCDSRPTRSLVVVEPAVVADVRAGARGPDRRGRRRRPRPRRLRRLGGLALRRRRRRRSRCRISRAWRCRPRMASSRATSSASARKILREPDGLLLLVPAYWREHVRDTRDRGRAGATEVTA